MIRFALKSDCEQLAALSIEVWLETYAWEGISQAHANYVLAHFTEQQFSQALEAKDTRIVVVEENGCVFGYASMDLASQFGTEYYGFEIARFYVRKPQRGRGYGRQILDFIRSDIGMSFWLFTWVHNPSNTFYERYGFEKIGEHRFQFAQQDVDNNVYAFTG